MTMGHVHNISNGRILYIEQNGFTRTSADGKHECSNIKYLITILSHVVRLGTQFLWESWPVSVSRSKWSVLNIINYRADHVVLFNNPFYQQLFGLWRIWKSKSKKDLKISPMKNSLEFSPCQVSDQSKIPHRRHKLPLMSKRYRNNTASFQLMPNCTNTIVPIAMAHNITTSRRSIFKFLGQFRPQLLKKKAFNISMEEA